MCNVCNVYEKCDSGFLCFFFQSFQAHARMASLETMTVSFQMLSTRSSPSRSTLFVQYAERREVMPVKFGPQGFK
jgi:hypothetical protein